MSLIHSKDNKNQYRPTLILEFGVMGDLGNYCQKRETFSTMVADVTSHAEIEIYEAFCRERCISVCKTSGSDFPGLKRFTASSSKNIE